MTFKAYIYVLIFSTAVIHCNTIKVASLEKVYKKGVEAYNKERWTECIAKFEEALYLYKLYKTILINCRLKCKSQQWKSQINEGIEDLKIYEKFLNSKLCLTHCLEEDFKNTQIVSAVPETILYNMQSKKPYEFLHMCYFQMNALPKAASAAYTYLVANPKDEKMEKNVKYYIDQPEVDINEVVDLESEDYKILYQVGLKAYNSKQWAETVANMEEALTDYLSWENKCRAECQHQPDLEWSSEFTLTISNSMLSLLICQQKCQVGENKYMEFTSGLSFVAEILNYLQISYYHLERIEDAAKAVESYLLLIPNDEDMLENKSIYSTLTDSKNFIERSDISHYLKRDKYEKILINTFLNLKMNDIISFIE